MSGWLTLYEWHNALKTKTKALSERAALAPASEDILQGILERLFEPCRENLRLFLVGHIESTAKTRASGGYIVFTSLDDTVQRNSGPRGSATLA